MQVTLKGALSMKKLCWEGYPMTGEILVTFKGKPLITVDMVELEEERIMEEYDIDCISFVIGEGFEHWDRNILEYMIIDKIVREYAAEHNIADPISYYDALQVEELPVSDVQAQAFYNKEVLKGQVYDQSPEEIKHILRALKVKLSKEKRVDVLKTKIQELKKVYEVVVNEDYFKSDDVDIYDNK